MCCRTYSSSVVMSQVPDPGETIRFSSASLVWMLLALGCGRTPLHSLPTRDAAQIEPVETARDTAPDLGQDRARDAAPDLGQDRARDAAPDLGQDRARDIAPDLGQDRARDIAPDARGDLAADNSPDADARATPDRALEAARDAMPDADAIDARARACAWGGLSALETYAEGSPSSMHPTRVAAGDFNHDGHLDFAATDQNETVSVFINNGDGGFAPQVMYAGTPWANQVATGDFNGDGYVDIAVADGRPSCGGQCCSNGCDGEVAVLINHGDGTFASPAYYDSGGNFASGLAVGDLNGDGHPDFVVTNYNANTLAVLLNRGDGTFAAPVAYPTSNPDTIALADLDGDGALDVVVGLRSFQPSSIETFFNDGTGALTAGATYNFGPISSSGLATATSIVSGDFEGTGHTDLIVGDTTGDHLFLYANPGNGVFGTPATIDAGGRPGSLVATDFNGDGKLDIATGLRLSPDGGDVVEEVAVLMGDGRGGFSQPILYADNMPSGVAAGDFNGDGYPDLLTGNSSWVSVLSSQCGGDAGAGYDSQDARAGQGFE